MIETVFNIKKKYYIIKNKNVIRRLKKRKTVRCLKQKKNYNRFVTRTRMFYYV